MLRTPGTLHLRYQLRVLRSYNEQGRTWTGISRSVNEEVAIGLTANLKACYRLDGYNCETYTPKGTLAGAIYHTYNMNEGAGQNQTRASMEFVQTGVAYNTHQTRFLPTLTNERSGSGTPAPASVDFVNCIGRPGILPQCVPCLYQSTRAGLSACDYMQGNESYLCTNTDSRSGGRVGCADAPSNFTISHSFSDSPTGGLFTYDYNLLCENTTTSGGSFFNRETLTITYRCSWTRTPCPCVGGPVDITDRPEEREREVVAPDLL